MSKMKTGGNWTNTLFFDSEADKPQKEEHRFPDNELQQKMEKFIATTGEVDKIDQVQVYKTPHNKTWRNRMSSVPLLENEDQHVFLGFLVGKVTWSLELTNGGITLQKSKKLDNVTKFCRGRKRPGNSISLTQSEMKTGNTTLSGLFKWLQSKYKDWRKSNCHDFAQKVFKNITGEEWPMTEQEKVCGNELVPDEDGKYYAYYDAEAGIESENSKYWITEDQLLDQLQRYADSNEQIKTVIAYKTPLEEWQWTFKIFYHLFIVLETDKWWWSIEKNNEGLTIQRSVKQEAVRDHYRQSPRLSPNQTYWKVTEVLSDQGNKTIQELVVWLEDKKWLFREYHYTSSNCQHFGKAVFDYVSRHGIL